MIQRRGPRTVRRLGRLAAGAALMLGLAGGMAVSQAPSAVAGGWGCTGNQIDVYPVQTPSGEVWGYVHLFWDPNKTVSGEPGQGANCAVNVKAGRVAGVRTLTYIMITACEQTSPSQGPCESNGSTDVDSGQFTSYAGPVWAVAPGRCIAVAATTYGPGGTANDIYQNQSRHCN